jgi:hypothetical protein
MNARAETAWLHVLLIGKLQKADKPDSSAGAALQLAPDACGVS